MCGARFHTPTALALHMLENHTRKKDVHIGTSRHRKATTQADEEKERLTTILSTTEETPERIFYPRDNRNGPRLGVDNLEFQDALDNAAAIMAREGIGYQAQG